MKQGQPVQEKLSIRLFGGLSVEGGPAELGTRVPKPVWLIVALALFPDYRASDRQLEELLFLQESTSLGDEGARLRQAVLGARKLLGSPDSIKRELGSYCLQPKFVSVDIIDFEDKADRAFETGDAESTSLAAALFSNDGKILQGYDFPSSLAHPYQALVEQKLRDKHSRLLSSMLEVEIAPEDAQSTRKRDSISDLLRLGLDEKTHEVKSSWDDAILEVLETASREIFIATDFAAYASFSKPSFFESYHSILTSKSQQPRLKVRVHIYDKELRRKLLRKQFAVRWRNYESIILNQQRPSAEVLDSIPETPNQFRSLLEQFERRRQLEAVRTFDDLIAALTSEDDELTETFATNYFLTSDAARMPILMWVVDKKRAIFMSNESDAHFASSDPRLVELLYAIGRSYYTGGMESDD